MDGNKRTAVRAVTVFLEQNGWELIWDNQTQHAFVLEVAQGKYDVPQIAEWLARHIHPRER